MEREKKRIRSSMDEREGRVKRHDEYENHHREYLRNPASGSFKGVHKRNLRHRIKESLAESFPERFLLIKGIMTVRFSKRHRPQEGMPMRFQVITAQDANDDYYPEDNRNANGQVKSEVFITDEEQADMTIGLIPCTGPDSGYEKARTLVVSAVTRAIELHGYRLLSVREILWRDQYTETCFPIRIAARGPAVIPSLRELAIRKAKAHISPIDALTVLPPDIQDELLRLDPMISWTCSDQEESDDSDDYDSESDDDDADEKREEESDDVAEWEDSCDELECMDPNQDRFIDRSSSSRTQDDDVGSRGIMGWIRGVASGLPSTFRY